MRRGRLAENGVFARSILFFKVIINFNFYVHYIYRSFLLKFNVALFIIFEYIRNRQMILRLFSLHI